MAELEIPFSIDSSSTTPTSTPPSSQDGKTQRRRPKPRLPKRDKPAVETADFTRFNSKIDFKELGKDKEILQEVALLHHVLQHSRRLVVVTGAGISVAAGIPDFRSQTGLFSTLRNELKLKGSGKAMFDSSVYRDSTATCNFHTTVRDLHKLCKQSTPTPFHQFLSKIAQDDRLGRLYSQNIDCLDTQLPGLETKIPLTPPWPRTVQLHGTIFTMVCTKCGWSGDLVPEMFQTEDVPECPECLELENVRSVAGKRTQGVGRLRPRLVLYNEGNPDAEAIGEISHADLSSKPDGLIVVGTSLKIPGVRRIVREMANAVHAAKGAVVWMNVDDPPQFGAQFDGCFDLIVKGDCQVIPQLMEDYEKYLNDRNDEREQKRLERRTKMETNRKKKLLSEKQSILIGQTVKAGEILKGLGKNTVKPQETSPATAKRPNDHVPEAGNFIFSDESKRMKIEANGNSNEL